MENKITLYTDKKNCCGCSACANICPQSAIEMIADHDGFLYPEIKDTLCVKCGLCIKTCPIKNIKQIEYEEQNKDHIWCLNLQQTNKYGAVIAAAKLEDAIRELVRDDIVVETLNYYHDIPKTDYWAYHKDLAHDKQSWKAYIHELRNPLVKTAEEKEKAKIRHKNFLLFKDEFLHSTPWKNINQLRNEPINISALIAGSDVIWQPKRVTSVRAPLLFLDFGQQNTKRISFAASIDAPVNYKLKRIKKIYKTNLQRFDNISVREKSSVDFLQKLTATPVNFCCDPVLLFKAEDYNNMLAAASVKNTDSHYIYAYILDESTEIIEYCDKLSKEKGLPIYYYSNKKQDFISETYNCTADGPAEFLHRLNNADFIITTSYHCTVFSLLFHKQFIAFERSFVKGKKSIKTPELLKYIGLEDRIATNNSIPDINEKIDYASCDRILDKLRTSSWNYLKEALEPFRKNGTEDT